MAEESGIVSVTPDWITESVRNKSLQIIENFHPKFLIDQPSRPQLDSDLNQTDENMIASLLSSEFGEMISDELHSASTFESPAAAMDSLLSATLNAVITNSMQPQEKRNSNPMDLVGIGNRNPNMDGDSMLYSAGNSINPADNKMMVQNPGPALVRPQTKTALAKMLSTRLGGCQQDQMPGPMPQGIVNQNVVVNQGGHQIQMQQPVGTVHPQQQILDPNQNQMQQMQNVNQQWQQQMQWQKQQQQMPQQVQFQNQQQVANVQQSMPGGAQMIMQNPNQPVVSHNGEKVNGN